MFAHIILPTHKIRLCNSIIIGGIFIITSNLFVDALFWFFAIVGVFSLITDICTLISSHFDTDSENTSIVLGVKNQQETIEPTMRSLIRRSIYSQSAAQIPKIIVVDLGSTDDTPKILSHFERDYDFVHVTDKEGYIDLIKNMT